MADEFANQFDLGGEGSIATVGADGIALAAIQGLSERLDRRERRIDELERELDKREGRIDELEARLVALERAHDGSG